MTKDKEKENKEKFQDRLNDEVDFLRQGSQSKLNQKVLHKDFVKLKTKNRELTEENKRLVWQLKDKRKFDVYLLRRENEKLI